VGTDRRGGLVEPGIECTARDRHLADYRARAAPGQPSRFR
jgi:hypothetical protein